MKTPTLSTQEPAPDEVADPLDAELLAQEQTEYLSGFSTFDVPAYDADGEPVWDEFAS